MHKCQDCGQVFKSGRDFEDSAKHECIRRLMAMPLAELKARLAAKKLTNPGSVNEAKTCKK